MQIQFQPLAITDLVLLHSWFQQPHVAYWWQEPQALAAFHEKWTERITTGMSAYHTPWYGYIVTIDQHPIGYIQHFFVTPRQTYGYPLQTAKTIGLDFFIGDPHYLGKKLSVPIIEHHLQNIAQQNPHVSTVLIEPTITNLRAIHVYSKAGFKKLGNYTHSHSTVVLMYKSLG